MTRLPFRRTLPLALILCIATGVIAAGSTDAQSLFPKYFLDLLPFNATPAQTGSAEYLLSVGPDGELLQVKTGANIFEMSPDGRYVVLSARPQAGTDFLQVWCHDRLTGLVRCVSLEADGGYANASCTKPSVSNDGRYVTYIELRGYTGPATGDMNLIVHDIHTGTGSSLTSDLGDWVVDGEISGNGTFVTFERYEWEYVSGNRVYKQNLATGQRQGMPRLPDESHQQAPSISDDGSIVAYLSSQSLAVNGSVVVPAIEKPTHYPLIPAYVTVNDPKVSGDGRFVVFGKSWREGVPPDGHWEEYGSVHRLNVATGTVQHV
ncbi:MAG: hypothetical protein R6V19_17780, partial [Armatimonadota bacterium]